MLLSFEYMSKSVGFRGRKVERPNSGIIDRIPIVFFVVCHPNISVLSFLFYKTFLCPATFTAWLISLYILSWPLSLTLPWRTTSLGASTPFSFFQNSVHDVASTKFARKGSNIETVASSNEPNDWLHLWVPYRVSSCNGKTTAPWLEGVQNAKAR